MQVSDQVKEKQINKLHILTLLGTQVEMFSFLKKQSGQKFNHRRTRVIAARSILGFKLEEKGKTYETRPLRHRIA